MMSIIQRKSAGAVRDDILTELAARLGITDANLGAAIRTIAYSFGVEVAAVYLQLYLAQKGYYIREATGEFLDKRASDFGLTRDAARKAIGHITYTGTPGSTISVGDQIQKPATAAVDAVIFEATEAGTVPGGGSIELAVQALIAGEDGNVAAATITEQATSIAGVTSLSNTAQTRLGRAEEDDATLRARILRHIDGLSRGTVPAVRHGALDFRIQQLTLNGALSDSATEIPVDEDLNTIPIATSGDMWLGSESISYSGIDISSTPHTLTGVTRGANGTAAAAQVDGTTIKEYVPAGESEYVQSASIVETSGQVDIYLDDGATTGISPELVALIEGRLNGDGTDRNPGSRAAGTLLYCHAASLTTISIVSAIVVAAGYTSADVITAAKDRVVRAINALAVGEDVYAYKVAAVIQETPGVQTLASLSINSTAFVGSNTADASISATAVARTSTSNITIS